MKVIYDPPAAKLRNELRENIPKEVKLVGTIETAEYVTASHKAGFKLMVPVCAALDRNEKKKGVMT